MCMCVCVNGISLNLCFSLGNLKDTSLYLNFIFGTAMEMADSLVSGLPITTVGS